MTGDFPRMAFPNESPAYRKVFADSVWGLLDTIPDGRGADFFPKVKY